MPATVPQPIRHVVVPVDLSEHSRSAFAHGLKLTLTGHARLLLVHSRPPGEPAPTWTAIGSVREFLEAWGVLPFAADLDAFEALGVQVDARAVVGLDPVSGVVGAVSDHPTDLLVMGTSARSGLEWLSQGSFAESILRAYRKPALLIPDRARGLVDPETGELPLRRVLVPVAEDTPQRLLVVLRAFLAAYGARDVSLVLLHVGRGSLPPLDLPFDAAWTWDTENRHGGVVETILEAARAHDADLVVMATHGHDSLADDLRGSTTERVLHHATVPLLAVPC